MSWALKNRLHMLWASGDGRKGISADGADINKGKGQGNVGCRVHGKEAIENELRIWETSITSEIAELPGSHICFIGFTGELIANMAA